jgi:hypothetical protein
VRCNFEPNSHIKESDDTKFDPLTNTLVPPCSGPLVGATCVTTACFWYKNVTRLFEKSTLFTETSTTTSPSADAGAVHVRDVDVTSAAATSTEPNLHHARPPSKFTPFTRTVVPPASGPFLGSTDSTLTTGWYVNVVPLAV